MLDVQGCAGVEAPCLDLLDVLDVEGRATVEGCAGVEVPRLDVLDVDVAGKLARLDVLDVLDAGRLT